METNENLKKLQTFFNDNLSVKELMNSIIPNEMDFYNDETKFKYIDRILNHLHKIELYMHRMLINYNLSESLLSSFDMKVNELQTFIKSESFYYLLKEGYDAVLKYIHENVTNMRPEFIDSINTGFMGHYIFFGQGVLSPVTINEFLHYVHSFLINNERFYASVPVIRTTNENREWDGIYLRGVPNEFGNKLYEGIIQANIDAEYIDIINLDRHILIMARDLGHATVIEIEFDQEDIYVRYSIPKNNNKEMTSKLKGININKDEFATGNFQTTKESVVQDLCSLMNGIPTDLDMIDSTLNI